MADPWSVVQTGVSLLVGLGLASCVSPTPPAPQSAAGFRAAAPFTCRVEALPRAGQTEVRASISAAAPVSGLFWLELAQTGPGNSARIAQSGPFAATAGETLTLGTARFSAGPAALQGRLTIGWAEGEVRCPVTAPMAGL